jgi:YidC/Oxa1 family membrane protein insertase
MDRRTVVAFVLIGLVLIFTQTEFYKSKVLPERGKIAADTTSIDVLKKTELIENERDTLNKAEGVERFSAGPPVTPGVKDDLEEDVLAFPEERRIEIVTPEYEVVLSNRGGGIVSWKLHRYLDADSQFVSLVPPMKHGVPGIGVAMGRDTVRYDDYLYEVTVSGAQEGERIYLKEENPDVEVRFRLAFKDGRSIEKRFRFRYGQYNCEFELGIRGFQGKTSDKSYHLIWDASPLPTEEPVRDDLGYTKIYAYLGNDLQDFNVKETQIEWKSEEVTGIVNWAAVRTKYFVSAIVPLERKGRSLFYRGRGVQLAPGERFKRYEFSVIMPLEDEAAQSDRYVLYLGPLEYNELKSLGLNLEKLIMSSSGYERLFRPFSIAILVALKFMQRFIPNWGLVIVVFSILIKLLLYPLTHKSYTSMKKMQQIQPLMAELREKYKNDPQRLNREMMKLYKEYGVNPMGGCLPMLLQMPLLIGLFIVFRSTIELRGAEFIWWIKDLSKPDVIFTLPFSLPFYGNHVSVLPLAMGLSMFLQQKSSMQDPRQKAMAYFMPIFFVLLFNSFPSGLNLYYTLFNLLTVVQQKFIKTEPVEIKPVEKKKGRGRKGKRA